MADDFVDICVVCKKGVPKAALVYQKGRVFHSSCFTEHGSTFPVPDKELDSLSARTRVDLVLLKNLKARGDLERQQMRAAKPKKKAKAGKSRARPRPKKAKSKKTVKKKAKAGKSRAKARTPRKGRSKGTPKRRPRR